MTERDDDLLREALRAEAADVEASDDLRARIHGALTDVPAARSRARGRLLAVAAVAALAAGTVVVLASRDDDESVHADGDVAAEVGDAVLPPPCPDGDRASDDLLIYFDPDVTRSVVNTVRAQVEGHDLVAGVRYVDQAETYDELARLFAEQPELVESVSPEILPPSLRVDLVDGAPISQAGDVAAAVKEQPGIHEVILADCGAAGPDGNAPGPTQDGATTTVAGPSERPTLVALVREDGWLVTVDLSTGEVRELHTVGDPRATDQEGGPYFIGGVELSPDGQWIWFSTCCEPASGNTYRIPVAGGEPELIAMGAYPRVSPDGRWVATGGADHLIVSPTQPGAAGSVGSLQLDTCCIGSLAWSPDGRELAAVVSTGAEGEVPQVRRFTWDGTTLAEASMGKPDNPGWFVMWQPGGMLTTSEGDPVADDRGWSQDRSYEWILSVDEEGVVREQAGFYTGDITPISGLPEAIAADW